MDREWTRGGRSDGGRMGGKWADGQTGKRGAKERRMDRRAEKGRWGTNKGGQGVD